MLAVSLSYCLKKILVFSSCSSFLSFLGSLMETYIIYVEKKVTGHN